MENYMSEEDYYDFLKEIGNYKILSNDEIIVLIKKARLGDIDARNKIMESCLKLVIKIALKYKNYGIPVLDLINSGTLSIERAIEKYDFNTTNLFTTYATYWIKQGMQREIENHSKIIRIPTYLHIVIKKLKDITDEFYVGGFSAA